MRRRRKATMVWLVFALTTIFLSHAAYATEYTWGDHAHLWENNYNTSAGTDYGDYRVADLIYDEYDDPSLGNVDYSNWD